MSVKIKWTTESYLWETKNALSITIIKNDGEMVRHGATTGELFTGPDDPVISKLKMDLLSWAVRKGHI